MADHRLVLHPLFDGIERARIEQELDRIAAPSLRLEKGAVYLVQGDPYERLGLLLSGRMDATMISPSGKQLLVESLEAPETIAGPVFFTETPRVPVTLTAVTAVDIAEIPATSLGTLADRQPAIYRRLLQDAGTRIMFLSTRLRLSNFRTLRQKIAGFLLTRAGAGDPGPVQVDMEYDRETLASLFGVARPSLSRTLGELVDEGYMSVSGRTVTISSPERLRSLLD